MGTTRQAKVNSLLKKEISSYLLNRDFEGIRGLLTITNVDVSPDLEQANVFFSVVGQPSREVAEILKKNIYEIQGMLNRKLIMRKVPRIVFVLDNSGEYAQHIGKLIRGLKSHDSK